MSLLKRFIIVNIILISGLLFYLSYLSLYPQGATQSPEKNEVLAATTQEFNSFALATINQYPVISYPDGRSVPFQDRFAIIRKYSSPSKFTNHLCNSVDERSDAWKNGTSCTGYTNNYNPTFIKLNFDDSEKLMLYAYYGLYAIDSGEKNIVEWQSAHIDRIQNATAVYPCGWTYDPSSVIPVKSGSNFYLFSKFSGHQRTNDSRCLQFYDEYTNRASYSQANGRLYLGYEINSDGKLNTKSYTRTTVAPYTNFAIGGPFGPGPKNATLYATSPTADIYGCKAYDSNKRCISVQGVALQTVTTVPTKSVQGTCKTWGTRSPEYVKCTYSSQWVINNLQSVFVGCNPSAGQYPKCPNTVVQRCDVTGAYILCENQTMPCSYTQEPTGAYSQQCAAYNYTIVPGSFKTAVNSPIFSNFKDFNPNLKTWNTNSTATPADYNPYKDETATNSTANALNFTKDLNSTVFTSNNYMFKVTVPSVGKLNVKRYPLNTTTYNPGSSSYIQTSTYSTNLTLGSSLNTKYSLHYYQNDIYLMASGSTTYNFWKLKNLNTTGANIEVSDLSDEISSKITTGTPKAFGIVSGKVYVIVGNRVYYATISGGGGTVVPDSNYGNFEVNGSVYTSKDLTEKFIVTNPSKKLEGNYVTSASTVTGTNIKSVKGATFSFDYPTTLPKTLFNFTVYSNSFNKFNLLVGSSTAQDPNPLASPNYVSISPASSNKFEIIYISQNRGVKIDLKNTNLNNVNFKLDKYIFVNLDKSNNSRINFTLDCSNATYSAYSVICTKGNKFYMKGALLGQFTIVGSILDTMTTTRFINVSENPDLLLNIIPELRSKKYPMVTTSKVNLKYSQ